MTAQSTKTKPDLLIIAVGDYAVHFNLEKTSVRDQAGVVNEPIRVLLKGSSVWSEGKRRSLKVSKAITKARTEAARRNYLLSEHF